MKTVSLAVLVALASAAQLPQTRFSCQECIDEMHHLGGLVRQGAPAMMGFLKEEYCPTLEGHEEQCQQDLVKGYVQMLNMVVQHYFVDGDNLGEHCEQVIGRHFPAMHELVIEEFWDSQAICNSQPVCGGEGPTKPPQH